MKGSYTVLIEVSEDLNIEVGALGEIVFSEGFYVYNGSAFGPGGLKRVDRHRKKSEEGSSPYWHIDYLLIQSESEIVRVFKAELDHECVLSKKMSGRFEGVKDFGCSDCGCVSHLFYSDSERDLNEFLENFYPDQESL